MTPDPLRVALARILRDHLWLSAAPWPTGADALWPDRLATRILSDPRAALAQPTPPLDVLRCVKCGGTDISTRWDGNKYDCTWSSRRDPGTQDGKEHLHRHCRNCSYGWGDPVAALSEPKP